MKERSAAIRENPFYVLGLPTDVSQKVVEREGQKLIDMLALGLKSAATYSTPVGSFARSSEKVRLAVAELRNPNKRLVHELWACLPPRAGAQSEAEETSDDDDEETERADAPWSDALHALGWRSS